MFRVSTNPNASEKTLFDQRLSGKLFDRLSVRQLHNVAGWVARDTNVAISHQPAEGGQGPFPKLPEVRRHVLKEDTDPSPRTNHKVGGCTRNPMKCTLGGADHQIPESWVCGAHLLKQQGRPTIGRLFCVLCDVSCPWVVDTVQHVHNTLRICQCIPPVTSQRATNSRETKHNRRERAHASMSIDPLQIPTRKLFRDRMLQTKKTGSKRKGQSP